MRRGVYPGSFNPPTVAHVAIAEAARTQRQLDEITLVFSRRPFDKESVERPPLSERLAVVEASFGAGFRVVVTDARLIADIAEGYDVVIMGHDKWDQLHDLRFYDSPEARDLALQRLPDLAIAPRSPTSASAGTSPPVPIPPGAQLDLDARFGTVSSTKARTVDPSLMTEAARVSGWWTPPS